MTTKPGRTIYEAHVPNTNDIRAVASAAVEGYKDALIQQLIGMIEAGTMDGMDGVVVAKGIVVMINASRTGFSSSGEEN